MYRISAIRVAFTWLCTAMLLLACGKDADSKTAEKQNATANPSENRTTSTEPKAPGEKPTSLEGAPGATPKDRATAKSETGDEPAKKSAQPVPAKSPEEQVKATLSAWCAAQKRGGYDAYRRFYAPEFSGIRRIAKKKPKTFDRTGWLKDRIHGFDSPVKVDCLNPSITLSSDKKRAEIKFEQYWRSNTYADQGDKKIIMTERDGKWLLIYEDMLTAQKWDRLNFRDGSPATAGPAAVKVGRLRLRKALPMIEGRDKPMKDYVHGYCYSRRPKKLSGFQMKVKPLVDAEVAAYRYRIRGSTTLYEDDEGYYACNERRLQDLGRGEFVADGNIIEVELDEVMRQWPCYYKIEVKAVDSEGVPLAKGRIKGDFPCPE